MRTFGVEEELLIVDPESGEPLALAQALLSAQPGANAHEQITPAPGDATPSGSETGLSHELKLEQIETQTRPCTFHGELLHQIRLARSIADNAARQHGARIAALATSPLDATTHMTPDPRYAAMMERFGLTVHEQLTCGLHVHTFIESPEEGVAIIDRIRDKLSVLTAISANSPYWHGVETGFESYRTQAWNRWPTAGPSAVFGSHISYRRVITRLLDTGVPLDEGMIYFDARLSRHHPTVEIRVADVCLRAEDSALIAVLVRALVETTVREWHAGIEPAPVPTSLLRMASWQASNFGLRGELLDFGNFRPEPAADVVWALVDYVEPVLAEQDELEIVRSGIKALLERGTGAAEQREAAARALAVDPARTDGGLAAVVEHAVRMTVRGADDELDTKPQPVLTWVRQNWPEPEILQEP
ncbi:glutamate--cysteine ligase [Arthrobacter sp. ISL-30]|uniref:glutamate--cysteine ligase n=1 Tax=Arthrobacter sp. ISL-30 TaxID=2819109 RepID=UPI001BEB874D|nr:glutamate--cysteine ligase [Arthrobacter sp. ISL-30]MBT2512255.1 glutamate--cysteine ligase [Arthrobacter sp. ISL-30]